MYEIPFTEVGTDDRGTTRELTVAWRHLEIDLRPPSRHRSPRYLAWDALLSLTLAVAIALLALLALVMLRPG